MGNEKRKLEIENRGIMAQLEALSKGKTKDEAIAEGVDAMMEFIFDDKIKGNYATNSEKLKLYKRALHICDKLKANGVFDYEATPTGEPHEVHTISISWEWNPLEITENMIDDFREIIDYADYVSFGDRSIFLSSIITTEI